MGIFAGASATLCREIFSSEAANSFNSSGGTLFVRTGVCVGKTSACPGIAPAVSAGAWLVNSDPPFVCGSSVFGLVVGDTAVFGRLAEPLILRNLQPTAVRKLSGKLDDSLGISDITFMFKYDGYGFQAYFEKAAAVDIHPRRQAQ